mgnify:FL=1|jgi:hypothetical protein
MSMRISPIQYGESRVIRFLFDTERATERNLSNGELVAGESQLTARVNNSFGKQDGLVVCDCSIDLTWKITASEEDTEPDVRIECKMGGLVVCPETAAEENAIRDALAMNGVTFVWGKIRDMIEALSRYSSTGLLVLPAIDPGSVLEGMEKDS